MENYFQAFSIGSATGDLDDLGGSFGRFSIRLYINGTINKQEIVGYAGESFVLSINHIAYRAIDAFSFGELNKKGELEDQTLGAWKYDLIKPQVPERFTYNRENWYKIENKTYRKLKERVNLNFIPKKFDLLTRLKTLNIPNDINPTEEIPFYI